MTDDFHAALEVLLNNNENLLHALEQSVSVDAALAVLSAAARQKQIELDASRFLAWLKENTDQARPLSHDELEEIAAGKRHSNTRTMGNGAARILKHINKPVPVVFGPQVE